MVLANFSNGYQYDVTGDCTFTCNDPVTFFDTKIVVSYTNNEVTKTLEIPITVDGKPVEAPATTLALYHLDGNLKDEVSGETSTGTYTSKAGKFDLATAGYNSTDPNLNKIPLITNEEFIAGQYTIECWGKNIVNDTYREPPELTIRGTDRLFDQSSIRTNGLRPYYRNDVTIIYKPTDYDENKWHHFAITIDKGTYKTYLDGKLSTTGTIGTYFSIQKFALNSTRWSYDEIMICNEVKYLADFEPPHAPYYLAGN